MLRDDEPCFYLYQQKMGDHVQVGVVAGASVAEYQNDLIKKHEHTRADKEEERTLHVDIVGANTGPVFLTYRARARDRRLRRRGPVAGRREVDFVSEDGIGHTLWVLDQQAEVKQAGGALRSRCRTSTSPTVTTAAPRPPTCSSSGPRRNPDHTRRGALQLLPDRDLPSRPDEDHGVQPRGAGPQRPDPGPAHGQDRRGLRAGRGRRRRRRTRRSSFGMYLDGALVPADRAGRAASPRTTRSTASTWRSCRTTCSRPILGIGDPRTDKRIQFVGGIRGSDELEKRADAVRRRGLRPVPHQHRAADGHRRRRRGDAAQVHLVRAQAAQRDGGPQHQRLTICAVRRDAPAPSERTRRVP